MLYEGLGPCFLSFSKWIYIVVEWTALAKCACFHVLFNKQETCKAGIHIASWMCQLSLLCICFENSYISSETVHYFINV